LLGLLCAKLLQQTSDNERHKTLKNASFDVGVGNIDADCQINYP